jgi:hypothetical protein
MGLLDFVIVLTVVFISFLKLSFLEHSFKRPIVGCLRTRNSGRHLDEYLSYHYKIGFTEIHLYDDSDVDRHDTMKIIPQKITMSQQYHYHDKRGVTMRKETDYLEECFRESAHKYGGTGGALIMSIDDDEFLVYPNIQTLSLTALCLWIPVKFFGSKPLPNGGDGTTLGTFQYRERSVVDGTDDMDYFRKKHPELAHVPIHYLSYRTNQRKISPAVTKAIFSLSDPTLLLSTIENGSGADYLHGFTTDCVRSNEQSAIWIAHHTRSERELNERIETFWKHIGNRRQRFTGSKSFLKSYKRDRDRNEELDDSVLL